MISYGTTYRKFTDDIWNDIHGGMPTKDSRYDKSQLQYKINSLRAVLAKNDIDKNGFDDDYMQLLPCIELEPYAKVLCCGGTAECTILRSVLEMPDFVSLNRGFGFTVYSTSDSRGIPVVDFGQVTNLGNRTTTALMMRAYTKPDGHLYIWGDLSVRKVNVYGILFDPSEARRFNDCDDQPCWTPDNSFPMKKNLLTPLADMVKEQYSKRTISETIEDKDNDNNSQV